MAALTAFFQAHPMLWQSIKLVFSAAVTFGVVVLLRLEKRVGGVS